MTTHVTITAVMNKGARLISGMEGVDEGDELWLGEFDGGLLLVSVGVGVEEGDGIGLEVDVTYIGLVKAYETIQFVPCALTSKNT